MIPRLGGKSHCMKLSKRFIILIWQLLYLATSLGHPPMTSHPHSAPNRAVKESLWNTSRLFWPCPLWQPKYTLPLPPYYACFLHTVEFHCHPFSQINFYVIFCQFPFHSQQETLFSQRQHNHSHYLIITEPHAVICRAGSLGRHEVSEMNKPKSSPQQYNYSPVGVFQLTKSQGDFLRSKWVSNLL